MTYSKLGNIKGPQGRRGLNMTGNTTPPPAVDDSVLEGDLWLDSTTGDVYRATDPLWGKDGTWNTWGTVLWKVSDNVLMVQPAEGDTGTLGEPVRFGPSFGAPWCNYSVNPSRESMTSVQSKGTIAVNENNGSLFLYNKSLTDISAISNWDISNTTHMEYIFNYCTSLADLSPISNWDMSGVTNTNSMFQGCTSLTNLSPLSGWDVSNVTYMGDMFASCKSLTDLSPLSGWNVSSVTEMNNMFSHCTSLTNLSPLSNWDVSGVTAMDNMFSSCTSLTDASAISNWDVSNVTTALVMFQSCPLERIGIPSLEHGGRKFVSNLKNANAVTDMDTTMLTNTTTHETMSANQMLADMDSNQSKYSTGTIWTL